MVSGEAKATFVSPSCHTTLSLVPLRKAWSAESCPGPHSSGSLGEMSAVSGFVTVVDEEKLRDGCINV